MKFGFRKPSIKKRMAARKSVKRAIHYRMGLKGHWRMANTIASGVGMTNAWLTEQGLLSDKTLWASLAGIR